MMNASFEFRIRESLKRAIRIGLVDAEKHASPLPRFQVVARVNAELRANNIEPLPDRRGYNQKIRQAYGSAFDTAKLAIETEDGLR